MRSATLESVPKVPMTSRKIHREKHRDVFEYFHVNEDAWPQEPQIDKIVNDLINPKGRDRVPGVAVAVRKNQQVVHLGCYGYANLEIGAKITPDTIFDLGSLSKQFTSLAVLELLANKKLDLSDHLSKFFKGFPRYADSITVEDLIHHTSALPSYTEIYVASRLAAEDWYHQALAKPDHWYPQMKSRRRKELTNKDVLQWIETQKLLPRLPDTEFEYCNSGYVVLAELVAKRARMRFAEFLEQFLFSNLKMKDTYVFDEGTRFAANARQIVNHAKCYNRVGRQFIPVGYTPLNFITGDGNVHSTITDLVRWELSLHVNDIMGLCFPTEAKAMAKSYGNSVRELLWSPVQLKHRKQVNYGAGWNLLRDKYEKEVEVKGRRVTRKYESRAEYHRGTWLSWRSYFARASRWPVPRAGKNVDPNTMESLGIVVLSNAVFGDNQFTTCRIAQRISQFYWGKWKKDNIMNNFNCG
jgi:CubicO group peptidase (beta-lactamase class C family)